MRVTCSKKKNMRSRPKDCKNRQRKKQYHLDLVGTPYLPALEA
jgi:hypothetical protein